MQPWYIATETFTPRRAAAWEKYVAWSGLTQLHEVVSLDPMLCPTLLPEIDRDFWPHIVNEDFMLGFFVDLEFLLGRLPPVADRNLLCVYRNPPGMPAPPSGPLDFEFLGLIGLEDPVRADVPGAIAECQAAGMRVVMMTGDHSATALAIARKAGIPVGSPAITGAELSELTDEMLQARLADTHVFSRVQPEQKLRLVRAFRARGDVVAMTGDGVNDAPALKAADIGVAMGARGTEVAREAAALVLLNDDFGSLVTAVRREVCQSVFGTDGGTAIVRGTNKVKITANSAHRMSFDFISFT